MFIQIKNIWYWITFQICFQLIHLKFEDETKIDQLNVMILEAHVKI